MATSAPNNLEIVGGAPTAGGPFNPVVTGRTSTRPQSHTTTHDISEVEKLIKHNEAQIKSLKEGCNRYIQEMEVTLQGKDVAYMEVHSSLSLVAMRYQITEEELRKKEENEKQLVKELTYTKEENHQMRQKCAEYEKVLRELESYYQSTKGARGASLIDQAKAHEQQIERQCQEKIVHVEREFQCLEEKVRLEERRSWIVERRRVELDESKYIGAGAVGKVCKGKFRGTQVAVKIYHSVISDQDWRRCEQEMVLASRLRHKNVVQFMAAVVDRFPPLLITELATGGTLGELWKKRPLLPSEVVSFALDVAEGLLYLHTNRLPILHRDIHLNNVLIFEAGVPQGRIAKLSDLGTANFERRSMSPNQGTEMLNAPEARTNHYTIKADVFSFGLLLLMMCFNDWRNQWQKGPDPTLLQLIEVFINDLPNQLHKVFDTSLHELVAKCCKPKPEDRPHMKEVVNELEKAKEKYPFSS